jgi:uncharacterized protein (UPF0210 family)
MNIAINEMMETITMVQMENLDIRTVTMGINLLDCADSDFEQMNRRVYEKNYNIRKRFKNGGRKSGKRIWYSDY